MSQYATSEATSPNRNDHFEGSLNEEQDENENTKIKRRRSKQDTWKGIFVVTQFWVICFAMVAFLMVVTVTFDRLYKRQTLETKDRVFQQKTWFRFAICLRPFMTDDTLREMYELRLNRSLEDHLASLKNVSHEEKSAFRRKFYLDDMLEPKAYQTYIHKVHPWEHILPSVLWKFQNVTIRKAFEEFMVNGVVTQSEKEKSKSDSQSGRKEIDEYDTLPPKTGNFSGNQPPLLVGEYLLSPMYLGCLSMTVNKEMASKQIEISVKFRPTKTVVEDETTNKIGRLIQINQFEAADIFVLNVNDTFTEIPTIKRNAKFSMLADSRERLLVKSSRNVRKETNKIICETNETYSEIDCRQNCIYKRLLEEINCTLPWMERIPENMRPAVNYTTPQMCTDLDAYSLMATVNIQESYLKNQNIMDKKAVQKCLQSCLESCKSFSVRILSLGSKSIGSNYGVTLTFSPAIDEVKEHFNYNFTNMVSELCASVSFLLGISAIAIYDWLVAFGVWVAIRLGLHEPDEETEEAEEAELQSARRRRSSAAGSPVGDSVAAGMAQSGDEGGQGGQGRRRVSLQLPGDRLMLPGDSPG